MPRPLHSKLGPVLVTTALAGLLAAGCGSDSSKSTSTTASTPTITKTAFVTKANAICAAGNKVVNAANSKLGQNPTRPQVLAVVRSVDIPSIQGQITAIRALGVPSGDEATVSKFLGLAQTDLDKVKANPLLLTSDTDPFADFAKVAHPYGLTQCDAA